MKLPRSFTVNGQRWRVVRKKLVHRGLMGLCLYRKREIQVDSELPAVEAAETFLHEVLHACIAERWSSKAEERLVSRLAPRLLEALGSMGKK